MSHLSTVTRPQPTSGVRVEVKTELDWRRKVTAAPAPITSQPVSQGQQGRSEARAARARSAAGPRSSEPRTRTRRTRQLVRRSSEVRKRRRPHHASLTPPRSRRNQQPSASQSVLSRSLSWQPPRAQHLRTDLSI